MKSKSLFFAIILIGLTIRVWEINVPLLEFNPSRQIQTAEISRNLYREGFKVLTPNVHYLGPGPGLFLVEFPLYNLAVALLYSVFGLHEYLGRAFSIFGWILSLFFLWKLAVKYVGRFAANAALFFYSFSPLGVLVSRSFQPDQWMLTSSMAAIYFLDQWLFGKRWYFFYLSAIFAAGSFLLKIPSILFTLIPVTYLILHAKMRVDLSVKLCYYFLAIVPSLLWYLWATIISRGGTTLQHNVALANWFGFDLFLNPSYYSNIFGYEINLVLGPIGILLFLIGFFSRVKSSQNLLYFWLGGVILYFLIFNKHSMTHEYYHLPFLPIAAIFIGIAVEKIYKKLNYLYLKKDLILVILSLFVFGSLFVIVKGRAYKPIDRFEYVPDAAIAIKRLSNQNDLIIGAMDSGPSLVYYADRSGWGFDFDPQKIADHQKFIGLKNISLKDPIETLEELRVKGAVIFASSNKAQLLQNKEFSQYIYSRYLILEETENYVIFDLRQFSR